MTAAHPTTGERRLVLAVSTSSALILVEGTTFNYVLPALIADFGLPAADIGLIRLIPNVGALLVVFLAGALGSRWGERRVMVMSTLLFLCGGVITLAAVATPMLIAGLLFMNMGRSVLMVVGIALIAVRVTGRDARASAFATYSAVLPFAYLFGPPLGGFLIDAFGWRAVGMLWLATGVGAVVILLLGIPASTDEGERQELLTPALAGLFLAGVVQAINTLGRHGPGLQLLVELGLVMVAVIGLVIALRRLPDPTLSIAVLRNGGVLVLLAVVMLANLSNLWFFMNLAFQYVWDLSALQTALLLIPAQLLVIVAARIAGTVVQRAGIKVAGTVFMVATGISLLSSLVLSETSPLWLGAAMLAVFGACTAATGVPVTNAVMDSVPADESGNASAYRSAAASIGSALSASIMTALVFGTMSMALANRGVAAGFDTARVTAAVQDWEEGAEAQQIVGHFAGGPFPVTIDDVNAATEAAYMEGLRAHGLIGAVVTFLIAGVFYVALGRQERTSARAGSGSP